MSITSRTLMTQEEHRMRHVELHKALDELVADFIRHNKDSGLSRSTVMDLMQWSHEQTLNPTPSE